MFRVNIDLVLVHLVQIENSDKWNGINWCGNQKKLSLFGTGHEITYMGHRCRIWEQFSAKSICEAHKIAMKSLFSMCTLQIYIIHCHGDNNS